MNIIKIVPRWSLLLLMVLLPANILFAGNIDPDSDEHKYGWAENTGWCNLGPGQGPGITVTDFEVTGFAWAENIGWVNFSPENFGGVVNDGDGNLSGWAWGENFGWISFSCSNTNSCDAIEFGVTIDGCSGLFYGQAWSENTGWIFFDLTGMPGQNNTVLTSWIKDTDGDASADCTDGCPADPDKIAPGVCGCGTQDIDANQNGTIDCLEAGMENPPEGAEPEASSSGGGGGCFVSVL